MKKGFTLTTSLKYLGMALIFGLFLMATGCNKEFENTLPKGFRNDTAGIGAGKKVLYIVLDGVTGTAVKTIAPPNITQINARATYTFDGLADNKYNVITNASAWTTMLTGYDYTKHNVVSEDFAGLNLQATPTIFTRINSLLNTARTVSIASTAVFSDKLAADATVKQTVSDDAAVKAGVVAELTSGNPALVVAQFHSAETAGAANGYTASTPAYATAIKNIDGYIGEILTALKARKGYSGENWLVIIASNKGGGPSGGVQGSNIFNDASRNAYIAFYNPRFMSVKISQPDPSSYPFVGTAPRFIATTASNVTAIQKNPTLGNFGTTGDFTFMFKFRDDYGQGNFYPMFLAKRNAFNSVSSVGWGFLFGSNSAQLDWGGTPRPGFGIDIRDGRWHTVAFTIGVVNNLRTLTLYVDGLTRYSGSISGRNIDNNTPLRLGGDIGTDGNTQSNVLIRDVALFNVTMSANDVAAVMRTQIKPTTPFYSNLLGFWPGNETSGTTMIDQSGKGNNFTYSSNVTFSSFEEISPNISPDISPAAYTSVPNGVDIPLLIYNWLNIAVSPQWDLTGRLYNPTVLLPTN
ncbi:LamG-like jellyroll fold domain-containing protein [Pedobacter rhizosphaerae]|uniref:DUF4983 domain-containing protein n=1 Tax=Pedobacter rhizosphaerae TaxID=390241 RepID=A0A1H9MJY8_9SPHI|nr:DUF4983 domain-containing protein [Pedobacter rhizosphaerae]SER24012.1 protein of unknown function [Pedobacter rhizosphaerae]